jgi:diaminohydroxyphosphoribosylaminopyrimidine deaminase/5-amino-6-(5-phosphoribosylamino)uracil reductase
MEDYSIDIHFMRKAINLAKKGRGLTSPNPMVGAIVVKDGNIIAEGYHVKAGTPHAEVIALNSAGSRAKGATLYVNVEPCCHTNKRTPPCTTAIIEAGIHRVAVSMIDPNPEVAGQGIETLQKAGIIVDVGILKRQAEQLNEVFQKYITVKKPYVILKVAQSLDGKIATASRESKWITGPVSLQNAHQLRHDYDAILVGSGTVKDDDPSLTARTPEGKDPVRIILDSNLTIPLNAKVLTQKSTAVTLIATTPKADKTRIKQVEETGAKVLVLPEKDGMVDLKVLMDELGRMDISSVLIEGGATVNNSALRSGIVDKVVFFIAPMIMCGHDAISSVGGLCPESLQSAIKLTDLKVRRSGDDLMVEGYVVKS